MTESPVRDLYYAELSQEANAGFPNLRRIPSTQVIRFLDFFHGLTAAQQNALLDSLAKFHSTIVAAPDRYSDLFKGLREHPVLGPFLSAVQNVNFRGCRYTPMKILGGVVQNPAWGGLEQWAKTSGFSELEMCLPEELVPNEEALKPIKPAALRKLVAPVLARYFAAEPTKISTDVWRYDGTCQERRLQVIASYSPPGRFNVRQFDYSATVAIPPSTQWKGATCEGLWLLHSHWDYLTEENAPRSCELLAQLIIRAVGFTERLMTLTAPA